MISAAKGLKEKGVQGRYIFPVIGILHILIAYNISKIPNNLLRRSFTAFTLILFLWGMWGSPLLSFIKLSTEVFPLRAIPAEEPIGEIVTGVTISQEFISECKGTIDQVDLLLATHMRTNTHPIIIRLIDPMHQVYAEHIISGDSIEDNTWRSFNITSLSESFGKTYRITITSPESTFGNAISIWSSATDSYPDGRALVNGKSTGTDLSFRYQCTQPVFESWFHFQ